MHRRLRLGLPRYVDSLPGHTGHGRAWQGAIDALIEGGDVRVVRADRRWQRPPDVWLVDGHQKPIEVDQPVVGVVYDAGWGTPELDETFDPDFLRAIIDQTTKAVEAASVIIVPSESTRLQMMEMGKPAERIVHAPLGVDLERFRPFRPGGPEVVARAGGDPSTPYVLFLGVAHPRKNLRVLRDAMTALAAEGLPHQLVLGVRPAGDRRDSADLMARATADLPGTTGRVVHLPVLDDDDLAAVMGSATAFCNPSLMEGFGLPVLEAMACGAAVVTSDRGSLPELVGDAGLVVPPTVTAIKAALASVLTDPALGTDLRQRARARAEAFSWDRTARHWLEALRLAVSLGTG